MPDLQLAVCQWSSFFAGCMSAKDFLIEAYDELALAGDYDLSLPLLFLGDFVLELRSKVYLPVFLKE